MGGSESTHRLSMTELERYIAGLKVTQGVGLGFSFGLLPWQRRFLRGAFAGGQTAAVTLGRGNGKSTLAAAVAAATLDGPLVQRRAETVVVASSFQQGRVLFEHCRAFLEPVLERDGVGPRGRWRIQDSINVASSGTRGHLMPTPLDGANDTLTKLRATVAGLRGKTALVETMKNSWGGDRGDAPSQDWKAIRLGANPPETMRGICSAPRSRSSRRAAVLLL